MAPGSDVIGLAFLAAISFHICIKYRSDNHFNILYKVVILQELCFLKTYFQYSFFQGLILYVLCMTRVKHRQRKKSCPSVWIFYFRNNFIDIDYTECKRIRYTTLKIYCDQTNRKITTQFSTEHLLTLQIFLQVFSMAATGCTSDIHTIF
jgi:hypothetical protein